MNLIRKNLSFISGIVVTSILAISFVQAANKKVSNLESVSQEAYIWGYPAVLMKQVREAMLAKTENPEKSLNHFFHSEAVPEVFLKNLITTNSENIYSWAWLDLQSEPLIFTQPSISNRYFSVQFVDAFTNVFQVISNQKLAGKAVAFALTSPSWKGDLPSGVIRIKSTTPEVFVLAQIATRGRHEWNQLAKLNHEFKLIPLSEWKAGTRTETFQQKVPREGLAVPTNLATAGIDYLQQLKLIVQKNSLPTSADTKQWQAYSKLLSPNPGADEKSAIERGLFAGARKINDRVDKGFGRKFNGWSYEMRAEPFREDYLTRAAVAQVNLFSTPENEFVHLKATTDSEDRQLYGNYKYTLHFNKGELPPTPTSWTLRVLETAGEKSRINDRSQILKYNENGSVDVQLQQEPPEKGQQANWLELSPESNFEVVLTIYNPSNEVLQRKFIAPAVTRVEDEGGLPRPKVVRTMMAQTTVSYDVSN